MGAGAGSDRAAHALFFTLLGLSAAAVVIGGVFPTTDGAEHVANAWWATRLALGDPEAETLLRFCPRPTNAVLLPVTAALLAVVGPLATLATMNVIALVAPPLALWAVLRRWRRDPWLALLVLPVTFHRPWFLGFWSFVVGLAVGILAVGLIEPDRPMGRDRWIRVAGALVLATVLHPTAGLCAAGCVGCMAFVRTDWRATLAAIAPPLGLLLIFLLGRDGGGVRVWDGRRLEALVHVDALVGIERAVEPWLWAWLALVAVGSARVLVLRLRRGPSSWGGEGLAVASLGLFVAVIHVPDSMGQDALLAVRGALWWLFVHLLWLGQSGELPRRWAMGLGGGSAALALALLAVRAPGILDRDRQLDAYLEAAADLEPGDAVLPLHFGHDGEPWELDPLAHASALLGPMTEAWIVTNYQPDTDHFQLCYAPGHNPYRRLASRPDLEAVPPRIAPARWPAIAPEIDVVLLWRYQRGVDEAADALRDAIEETHGVTFANDEITVARRRAR